MSPPDAPAGIEEIRVCPRCAQDRVTTRLVRTGPGAQVRTLFHVQCGCGVQEREAAPDQT